MKPSTGVTIKGFSKSGFSCCSSWDICDMGKGSCIHEIGDPEVLTLCRSYIRNHSSCMVHDSPVEQVLEELTLFPMKEEVPMKVEKEQDVDPFEQLTLF